MINSKKFLPIGFLVFVVIICGLLFTSEIINQRFWLNDFKVYYLSAKALLEGNQIYGISHGLDSGFYKYSPFVLLIFIPFAILPYIVACIIYYALVVAGIIYLFSLIKYFLSKYYSQQQITHLGWILGLIFIFALNLLYRELHLGNTNIFLLILLLLFIRLIITSKFFLAGILFSLILLIKPFFLILAIPLLIHKKWKIIGGVAVFMIIQALLLIVILGWSTFYFLHTEWIKAIYSHSASYPGNNTIEYLASHFFSDVLTTNLKYIILLGFILLYTFLITIKKCHYVKYHGHNNEERDFILGFFLLMSLLPSILNTDTEHFLYSLPVISLITYFAFMKKKPIFFLFLFLIFLLYGTNSNDIVGKTIGDFYDQIGALGISNLLLLFWGFWLFFTNKKLLPQE